MKRQRMYKLLEKGCQQFQTLFYDFRHVCCLSNTHTCLTDNCPWMLPFFTVRLLFCCPSVCSNYCTMFWWFPSCALVKSFGWTSFSIDIRCYEKGFDWPCFSRSLIKHRSCGRLSITISKLIASLFQLSNFKGSNEYDLQNGR